MVETVAATGPDAIVPFCTNLVAAAYAQQWEDAFGLPVLDSVTLATWHGLVLAGYDRLWPAGWGRFFEAG